MYSLTIMRKPALTAMPFASKWARSHSQSSSDAPSEMTTENVEEESGGKAETGYADEATKH